MTFKSYCQDFFLKNKNKKAISTPNSVNIALNIAKYHINVTLKIAYKNKKSRTHTLV